MSSPHWIDPYWMCWFYDSLHQSVICDCAGGEPCSLCNGTDWVDADHPAGGVVRCPNYDEEDPMGGSRCLAPCTRCDGSGILSRPCRFTAWPDGTVTSKSYASHTALLAITLWMDDLLSAYRL